MPCVSGGISSVLTDGTESSGSGAAMAAVTGGCSTSTIAIWTWQSFSFRKYYRDSEVFFSRKSSGVGFSFIFWMKGLSARVGSQRRA